MYKDRDKVISQPGRNIPTDGSGEVKGTRVDGQGSAASGLHGGHVGEALDRLGGGVSASELDSGQYRESKGQNPP